MKVTISNLGPIKQANIQLGKLTIFVGDNGTGKSIFAKVILGLLSYSYKINFLFDAKNRLGDAEENLISEQKKIFGTQVSSLESFISILTDLKYKDVLSYLKDFDSRFLEFFNNNLHNFFKDSKQHFNNSNVGCEFKSQLTLENFAKTKGDQIVELQKRILNSATSDSNVALINVEFVFFLIRLVNLHLFGIRHGDAYYVPATRSNFILNHNLLKSNTTTDSTEKLDSFDFATNQFLKNLNKNDREGFLLSDFIDEFEKEFFKDGKLHFEDSKNEVSYVLNSSQQPIQWHNTSSMIGEITPLTMILRSIGQPNSFLIIDEPESHLHPAAQQKLIEQLGRAINNNLRVILITHSPYILSCVNNLIKLGSILKDYPDDPHVKKIAKSKFSRSNLLIDEVRAYKFANGKTKNIISKKIKLIDESEFTEPFDDISSVYEKLRDIEWNHKSDK